MTPEYQAEQAKLHAKGNYGTASLQYGGVVSSLVDGLGAKTLLDYGCGSMRNLAKVLNCDVVYEGYDPAVPAFAGEPDPADLLASIDVLEHIEPACLDAVLDHMRGLSLKHAFLTIHTGPAAKVLSDGRNAHLIQEPAAWWLPKLMSRWSLHQFQAGPRGFSVLMVA